MGTSGSSRGSQSSTPLVPTWLEVPLAELPPNAGFSVAPVDSGSGQPSDGNVVVEPSEMTTPSSSFVPMPEEAERFRQSRTNFTRFAGSGGNNERALRRAVGDYVRSGTGGSRNAVKRMGASRRAARNVLGILQEIGRAGVEETLRYLNLQSFIGGTPQDIFIGLTEAICHDGGAIDEAIARDAWLETAAEIDQLEIVDLGALTGDQIRDVFLTFVAHAIEARLYQEIGVNGFRVAQTNADIERFDSQFRSYIGRSVRDSFSSDLTGLSAMSDSEIVAIVDRTYRETWELLERLGDLAR